MLALAGVIEWPRVFVYCNTSSAGPFSIKKLFQNVLESLLDAILSSSFAE